MTVSSMLGSMTQKEFCHWIAFHRIENEKDSPAKEDPEDEQTKRDAAMVSQLLALAGKKTPLKN